MPPNCCWPLRLSSPRVRVPVLSNTTVSMVFMDSRVWPRVGRKPSLRRRTVAEVIAVGVASDRAHGQVTTRTDRVISNALSAPARSEEHTSELQSRPHLVCRLLLEKKKKESHNA